MQNVHFDYAPKIPDHQFKDEERISLIVSYFKEASSKTMAQLSMLYFPEGGSLLLYPCDKLPKRSYPNVTTNQAKSID